MRALFFYKRAGGTWWRCGHCGEDHQVDERHSGVELRAVRECDELQRMVPAARQLLLGHELIALICAECAKQVESRLAEIAPRSLPDLDRAGNLLGDF